MIFFFLTYLQIYFKFMNKVSNVSRFLIKLRGPTLEHQDSNFVQVKIQEVATFMCHKWPEVPPDNTMPGGLIGLIQLCLHVHGYVLFHFELAEGVLSKLDRFFFHLWCHVRCFHFDWLLHIVSVCHGTTRCRTNVSWNLLSCTLWYFFVFCNVASRLNLISAFLYSVVFCCVTENFGF